MIKVQELMNQSRDNLDYIKRCYIFVRDEIPNSLILSELGEIDYNGNHADLDDRLVNILIVSKGIQEITTDFEF